MQHVTNGTPPPLIGSSARIIRGFSRVGVGAAVLTAVLGVAVTATVAFSDYRSATQFDPAAWGAKPASDLPDAPWVKKPANFFDQFDPKPAAKPFDPDEYLAQQAPPSKPGMFDDLIPSPRRRHLTDAEVGLAPPSRFNTEALSSAARSALGLLARHASQCSDSLAAWVGSLPDSLATRLG